MQVPIQTLPTVDVSAGAGTAFTSTPVEPVQDFTGKQLIEMGKAQLGYGAAMVRIADRLQGEVDDVKTAERTNALTADLDAILTEHGALNGKNAFDARPVFETRIKEAIAKHGGNFDNGVQEVLYNQKAMVLARTANSSVLRHSTTEFGKYDLVTSKAEVTGLVSNMARSWESRGQVDAAGQPMGDYSKYQAAAIVKAQAYANKIGIPIYEAVDPKAPLFENASAAIAYLKKNPGAELVLDGQTFSVGNMTNGSQYFHYNGQGGDVRGITEKFFTERFNEAWPQQVKKWAAGDAQPLLANAPDKLPQKKTAAYQALEREMVWEPAAISVTQSMMNAGQYGSAKVFLESEWKAGHIDEKSYQSLNDNVTTADLTEKAEGIAKGIVDGKRVISGVTYAPPLATLPKPSSGFGTRIAPLPGASTNHTGVDYPAPVGTPIYASADGVVEKAYDDTKNGGGNTVVLNHGDKRTTGYADMDRYIVAPGDNVKQGQLIGYVGQTGNATGPHLHYSMTDTKGNKIDPTKVEFGVAMNGGQIVQGPQSPTDKQAAIDAIADPRLRKMVQATYNARVGQLDATKERQKKENWQAAMDIAYAGDGNQWQVLSRTRPDIWDQLDATQQATLMNGRPRGDDPDTMIKLLSNPTLWEADKLKDYRHLISQGSYERFFSLGNGPKAVDNVRAATFDSDMFESTMINAKMPELVDPKVPKNKEEAINLRNKFRVLIDVEQTNKKRELTRDEKQRLLDSIVLDRVTVPGYLTDDTKPAFRLSEDEQKTAFVTLPGNKKVLIASIPPADRRMILQALLVAGKDATEYNIAEYYMRGKDNAGKK